MAKKRKPETERRDFPEVTREIKPAIRQALAAVAGGRCEFLGCNRFQFSHSVTKKVGYFGNAAHIRAFSPGGPRAGTPEERKEVDLNELENLMLLCQGCHTLVDTDEDDFPIEKLQQWKREHEEHVAYMLELPKENAAAVIEIWTSLANPPVVRSKEKVVAALLPLYPSRMHHALIDFASHDLSDLAVMPAAIELIDKRIKELFGAGGERPTHIAVFGVTNMPLLAYLGAKLGDRQDVRLFQYHRDTKDWKWKDEPAQATYTFDRKTTGTNRKHAALVLSLSGSIDIARLPPEIDDSYSIYELRLASEEPHFGFLRTAADLVALRETYRRGLAQMQSAHGSAEAFAIFPAVPIPMAVAIGMDRLPKVNPPFFIYDFDRTAASGGGWRKIVTVE